MASTHFFATDQTAVTVRFNLADGSEFAYVRADRFEQLASGVLFMLGLDVVAGLGPLDLVIYSHDGTERRVGRIKLATPPFVISGGGGSILDPTFQPLLL